MSIKGVGSSFSPVASASQPAQKIQEAFRNSLKEVDESIKQADRLSSEMISGENPDIQATMIALTKAELGLNLQVQVRNKVLEAYAEIMRLQI